MFQRVSIIGHLGADPTMKYTEDGTPVTSFSVATSETWKKDGEKKQRTTWFRIQAWEKLAEPVNEYLHKGSKVFVEGVLTPDPETGSPRMWEKDGVAHTSYELRAQTVKFLDSRQETQDGE
jgi:single-strand DNA-binding protein